MSKPLSRAGVVTAADMSFEPRSHSRHAGPPSGCPGRDSHRHASVAVMPKATAPATVSHAALRDMNAPRTVPDAAAASNGRWQGHSTTATVAAAQPRVSFAPSTGVLRGEGRDGDDSSRRRRACIACSLTSSVIRDW